MIPYINISGKQKTYYCSSIMKRRPRRVFEIHIFLSDMFVFFPFLFCLSRCAARRSPGRQFLHLQPRGRWHGALMRVRAATSVKFQFRIARTQI